MNSASSDNPETPGQLPSRRFLLRGGTVLGLSAIAGSGLAAQARRRLAPGAPSRTAYALTADALTADSRTSGNMILDYKPSQPSGWPKGPQDKTTGMTTGGHVSSADFTYSGTAYTVSLLPSGQSGNSPDPVYEAVPADPVISFQQTLDSAFSSYYAFRYLGDSAGWGKLSVQSYSVFTIQPTQTSPGLIYGANLYVVHVPADRLANPATRGNLRWIQVVHNAQATFVDDSGRANPFYLSGGLTSIYGRQVVNFIDTPQATAFSGATGALPDLFMAELFLAEDTGTTDSSGKAVVNIFGGLKYGWQLQKQ